MDTIFAILSIYIFIMLGYFAKHSFKERVDEKTLVYVSIYFLQPFLILWGFSSKKLDLEVLQAPFIFFMIVLLFLSIAFLIGFYIFSDKKDRSIFIVTSIIGNTGNLGIPIGILLFGQESVIYTTFINIVNIFLVFIVGVFFYSLGNFTIKESFKNIFKLPAIWFTTLAIFLNVNDFHYPKELELPLKMGAYATMVIQLFIFGMYLRGVKFTNINWRLFWSVNLFKFILIPIISIWILNHLHISTLLYNIILLELIVPIAVMNVNLASLYSCKPKIVAFLTFSTSFIFLFYLIFTKWYLFY